MNVTYVYADSEEEWNCAEWRCAIPSRAINRSMGNTSQMFHINEFTQNTPKAQEIINNSDIVILQRNMFGATLSRIQHWQALGKTIVVDFDDAYHLMHPSVKNHKLWIEGKVEVTQPDGTIIEQDFKPHPMTQFKWGLRLVDAATVPCRKLAEDWQDFANMYIVPNYLELPKYLSVKPVPAHEEIIIGWGGSLSHLQSFTESGVPAALRRICRKRPDVRVMICGDIRVYEQINLPEEQKMFSPFVPPSEWPNQLAWFDIGIAPLQGPYDERRSWIKVLEYLIMKIPWVATDYPPYEDFRPYGKLVHNDSQAWEKALLEIIDSFDEQKEKAAKEPYEYALHQGIDENVPQIISTYAKIIKNHQ